MANIETKIREEFKRSVDEGGIGISISVPEMIGYVDDTSITTQRELDSYISLCIDVDVEDVDDFEITRI